MKKIPAALLSGRRRSNLVLVLLLSEAVLVLAASCDGLAND